MAFGRGENIGDAYIRIHADGSGMGDDIRDSLAAEDDAIRQRGSEAGDRYGEGFAEAWDKRLKQGEMRESFAKNMASQQAVDRFVHSRPFREFRNRLVKEYGLVGAQAGKNFEQDLIGGMSFDAIRRRMNDITPDIARATRQVSSTLAEAQNASWRDMIDNQETDYRLHIANLERLDRERDEEWQNLIDNNEVDYRLHVARLARLDQEARDQFLADYAEAYRIKAKMDREDLKQRMDLDKQWEISIAQMRDTLIEAHEMNVDFDRQRQRSIQNLTQSIGLLNRETSQLLAGDRNAMGKSSLIRLSREIRSEMQRLNVDNRLWVEALDDTDRSLARLSPRLRTFNAGLDRVSVAVGRSMGYGSRNNFLNFIGSLGKNLFRVMTLPFRFAEGLGRMAGEFMRLRRAGSGLFSSLFGSLGALGSLSAGLAAVAGMAAGLLIILPPLVAAMSLLAGVVTALAGSLSFALVGAIGAVGALLAPLAAGVMVTAAAFMGLSEAQKEALKADAAPLLGALERLQDVARQPILDAVGEQARRMAPVIDSFQGSVRGIAEAVADVGDSWVDAMSGPGFARFVNAFESFIPDAVRRLGSIFEGFTGGMGGLFRGMIPFMRESLAYLDRLFTRFSDWANSARGQRDILNFFESAKESLKSVANFMGSVKDLFGELLSAGRETGDSLFDSMAGAIDGWVAKIQANPDILRDWFNSAREFGETLGDVIVSIGKLFDTLDNAASRAVFTTLFAAFGDVVEDIADVIGGIGDVTETVFTGLGITFKNAEKDVLSYAGTFDELTGAITRATREVAFQKLQQTELADTASQFGISQRDLVSAMLGQEGAVKRVNKALQGNGDLLKELTGAGIKRQLAELGIEFKDQAEDARTSAQAIQTWNEALKGVKGKDLRADVRLIGMDATVSDLKKLDRQYDLTPKEIRTIVKATGIDLSKKELRSLIDELTRTDNKTATPKIKVDKRDAEAGTAATKRALEALGAYVATPSVNVQAGDAQRTIEQVAASIRNLQDRTVYLRTVHTTSRLGDPKTATGGIFEGARGMGVHRIIGEAGPEAVVPLNRNLSQVDPAVRFLSAIAQGKVPHMAAGGTVGTGKTIDVGGITVLTPNSDPKAVAHEVVNTLVATGY